MHWDTLYSGIMKTQKTMCLKKQLLGQHRTGSLSSLVYFSYPFWSPPPPALCVQIDFTRTFETNPKCTNINHVWRHLKMHKNLYLSDCPYKCLCQRYWLKLKIMGHCWQFLFTFWRGTIFQYILLHSDPSSIYSCSIGHIWEHEFCHLGSLGRIRKFLKRRNFCLSMLLFEVVIQLFMGKQFFFLTFKTL